MHHVDVGTVPPDPRSVANHRATLGFSHSFYECRTWYPVFVYQKNAPYEAFGLLVAVLRAKAGMQHQADLAARVKTAQQTISRYEKGLSRPKAKDIPALAAALDADPDELLVAAGYVQAQPAEAATFDQLFPVDALLPDRFERFCLYLLDRLHPGEDVHRAGTTGHKQHGLDIEVAFRSGEVHTFQCKRVAQFGAKKVQAAVEAHTRVADKKVFLISRIASPGMRAEVRKHAGWDVWDKEDIALKVRSLPREEQLRLVDTFFRGQRLALLGETEAGPWLTLQEFLAPFSSKQTAFNHRWALVGREGELSRLQSLLSDKSVAMTLVLGAGGLGKTRLLAQALEAYSKIEPSVLLRVLSATELVSGKALEDLGGGEKLLVVDDAHEREDLRVLFEHAANLANKVRLLIAARTYGASDIRNKAAAYNLVDPRRAEMTLTRLSDEAATELAREVLREYGGPEEAAADVASATRDCTLATVMGAQIVAKDRIHPALIGNQEQFRSTLIGKFAKVVAGEIAAGPDTDRLARILRLLALVQPLTPEDPALQQLLAKIESISLADSNRLLRLLIDAGVLSRRGGKYRIAPDLLADHLIESSCITVAGTSSGYAEQVFDEAPPAYLELILVNLGKLDWRRANGDPANSRLLDGMWQKLRPVDGQADPHMDAVSAVAYYQPARALDFAEDAICQKRPIRGLVNVVKHAAYNYDYLDRACACLWSMGRDDARELHQDPSHAIRILRELCAVWPGKQIEYNQKVVEFALRLLESEAAWGHAFDPYDILEGILQTEGHTSSSNGLAITMTPFLVRLEAVRELRQRVVDAAVNRLDSDNTQVAVRSAAFLSEALRFPIGLFGAKVPQEDYAEWTAEFVDTLSRIDTKIRASRLDPVVSVELRKSLSWHANYSKSDTGPAARKLLGELPDRLQDRTILALVDGYGHHAGEPDRKLRRQGWEATIDSLADELLATFGADELRDYVAEQLLHIKRVQRIHDTAPNVLYGALMHRSAAFCRSIIESALTQENSAAFEEAGRALAMLGMHDAEDALAALERLVDADDVKFKPAALSALASAAYRAPLSPRQLKVLRHLMASGYEDDYSVNCVVNVVRGIAKHAPGLASELLETVPFRSAKAADEVLSLCMNDAELGVKRMRAVDVATVLAKLEPLRELRGYWIDQFLAAVSQAYSVETAAFFMRRVEFAAKGEDYGFRACNWGPYMQVPLRFSMAEAGDLLRRQIWEWMRANAGLGRVFFHYAARFFSTAFPAVDDGAVLFLQERVRGDALDLRLIGELLREVPPTTILVQSSLVQEVLVAAEAHGQELFGDIFGKILAAATTGSKSGTAGQPFPRDVHAKDASEAVLRRLQPTSPAHRLYDMIRRDAERNIEQSVRQRQDLEDAD